MVVVTLVLVLDPEEVRVRDGLVVVSSPPHFSTIYYQENLLGENALLHRDETRETVLFSSKLGCKRHTLNKIT
jgi:hypothetical protein